MTVKLTLPIPLSVNRLYKRGRNGQVHKTDAAKAYEWEVASRTVGSHTFDLGTQLVLHIDIYRPNKKGDIDNYLKLLLDALEGRLYYDDNQIIALHVRRFDDPKRPRVEVTVKALAS